MYGLTSRWLKIYNLIDLDTQKVRIRVYRKLVSELSHALLAFVLVSIIEAETKDALVQNKRLQIIKQSAFNSFQLWY